MPNDGLEGVEEELSESSWSGRDKKDYAYMAIAAAAASVDAKERPALLALAGCFAIGKLLAKSVMGAFSR